MTSRRWICAWGLLGLWSFGLMACAAPPSHLTRLWPKGELGEPVLGVSTEDGVLILSEPSYSVGQLFEIRFRVGDSLVVDWGRIDRLNDYLAVVRPLYAKLAEGRIAQSLPLAHETVYLAVRDERDEPLMEPGRLWRDGDHGDYLVVDGGDSMSLAQEYAGTGLYVKRDERWQIVGLLSGLVARPDTETEGPWALGFIGLSEVARIIPRQERFYEQDVRPLRPDFEYGVPLQPGDIDLEAELPAAPEPPAEDEPAPERNGER